MATDAEIEGIQAIADAMAEVSRILSDDRYPDRMKVFAANVRIQQLQDRLVALRVRS